MFAPLLRTIPTLSGNIKLSCYLTDFEKCKYCDLYDTYIRVANLSPMQTNLYNRLIKINLLTGSWEHDIKQFFYYYSSSFYNENFIFDKSDYQKLDMFSNTPLAPRNKDYEFGVRRLSYGQIGKQFEFYAPIYIDNSNELPESFDIYIKLNDKITKKIKIHINDKEDNNKNYLFGYIKRYVDKIDDNVIYCLPESNQAAYFGIDAINGGLVEIKDNVIGSIYKKQKTINNFDYTICEGFKRNKLIMRQVIPLSFVFDINDILTEQEQKYYCNYPIKIYGKYSINNVEYDFYDFDINYTDVKTNYLEYDDVAHDFIYKVSSNILNKDFPCLKESRFTGYKYTNKLTPTYNRWKLKYTSNEHPYITNMAYIFSNDLSYDHKYGEFPILYNYDSPEAILDEKNLLIPNENDVIQKYMYTDLSKMNYERFKKSMNNYISNWFEVIREPLNNIENTNIWSDVKDKSSYYKGILYNFNKIKLDVDTDLEFDKFGVFVFPTIDIIDLDSRTLSIAGNIISENSKGSSNNVAINKQYDTIEIYDNEGNIIHSCYNSIFYNMTNGMHKNNSFLIKNQPVERSDKGKYVEYDKFDDKNIYYRYSDIKRVFGNVKFNEDEVWDSYELLPSYYNMNVVKNNGDENIFIYENEIIQRKNNFGKWIYDNMYASSSNNNIKMNIYDVYKKINPNEAISGKYSFFMKAKFISEYDILNIVTDKLTGYDVLKKLPQYRYNIISNKDALGDNYFERIKSAKDDVVWVDSYMIDKRIIEYLNENKEKYDNLTFKQWISGNMPKSFYAKFLDKEFIVEWKRNLHKSYENQFSEADLSNIYYKKRVIVNNSNYISNVIDEYKPITELITGYTVDKFINALDNTMIDGMFVLNTNIQHIKYSSNEDKYEPVKVKLDLYFNKKFYKLDSILYDMMNIDDNKYMNVNPLYIYKLNNDLSDLKDVFEKAEENETDIFEENEDGTPRYSNIYRGSLKPLFISTYKNDIGNKHILSLFNSKIINKVNDEYKYMINSINCLIEYNFENEFRKYIKNYEYYELMTLFSSTKNETIISWINTLNDIIYINFYELLIKNEDGNILQNFVDNFNISIDEYNIETIKKIYMESSINDLFNFFKNYDVPKGHDVFENKLNGMISYFYTVSGNEEILEEMVVEMLHHDENIKEKFIKEYINKNNEELKLYSIHNTVQLNFKSIEPTENLKYYDDFNIYVYTDPKTGIRYGFYYISCIINNTNYTINIINDSSSICTFEKINNKSIIYKEKYGNEKIKYNVIDDAFKYLVPFFTTSLFNKYVNSIKFIVKQVNNIIDVNYYPVKIDSALNENNHFMYEGIYYDKDDEDKNVYDIKFFNNSKKKFTLNRYFNRISPILKKTYMIEDSFNLLYKTIDKFVCDNNIYKTDLNINLYEPIHYIDNWDSIHHKSKSVKEFYEYEHKHFNDNRFYNLETYFEISIEKLLTYKELLDYEKEENIIKLFKIRINNLTNYKFDNNEILFLYKKYNVNCTSESVKTDSFKTQKLYNLTYKFTLI